MQALRPSIPALTSLRFFAALVVVLHHYDARQGLLPFAIFDRGYEAVTFFFVLSGFILTYVHCTGPDLRQLNVRSRAFMVARAARILPAYYLALGLAAPFFLYSFFVAQTLAWPQLVGGLIAVPLLLQAWYPPTAVLWNTPAWSLSVEAFFYALFPAICRLMGRRSAGSALSLSFLAVVATSLLRQHFFDASSAPFGTPWHSFCAYFPVFHLPQFIFGMALGRCFIKHGTHSSRANEMLLLAGVIGLSVILFLQSHVSWLLSDPMLVIVFGSILFGSAAGAGFLTKALATPVLVFLGEASYATYIAHGPIFQWWRWGTKKYLGLDLAPSVDLVGYLSCVLILSGIILVGLERPARAWLVQRSQAGEGRKPITRHRAAPLPADP